MLERSAWPTKESHVVFFFVYFAVCVIGGCNMVYAFSLLKTENCSNSQLGEINTNRRCSNPNSDISLSSRLIILRQLLWISSNCRLIHPIPRPRLSLDTRLPSRLLQLFHLHLGALRELATFGSKLQYTLVEERRVKPKVRAESFFSNVIGFSLGQRQVLVISGE